MDRGDTEAWSSDGSSFSKRTKVMGIVLIAVCIVLACNWVWRFSKAPEGACRVGGGVQNATEFGSLQAAALSNVQANLCAIWSLRTRHGRMAMIIHRAPVARQTNHG